MKDKPFISIKTKVLSILLICLFIPFATNLIFAETILKPSMKEEFNRQTIESLSSAGNNISDYVQRIYSSSKGIYFNPNVVKYLAGYGQQTQSQALRSEAEIFDFLQTVYAAVPEASQVHLSAFNLKKSLLLQSDMQRYEKIHIYLNNEISLPGLDPYTVPAHMQSDYNFQELTEQPFDLVFSVCVPVANTPASDVPIGEITVDIPVSSLDRICKPLYDSSDYFCIIDDKMNFIYSSDVRDLSTPLRDRFLKSIDLNSVESYIKTYRDNNKNVLSYVLIPSLNWYIIKVSPKSSVYRVADYFFNFSLASFIIVTSVEFAMLAFAMIRFTSPIRKLTEFADAVSSGSLDEDLSSYVIYTRNDEIRMLIVSFRKMLYSIREFTVRQYEMALANKTTELKALQAQINPHFLFNTLQSLATTALVDGDEALYQSITDLGAMMRYTMSTDVVLVPLKDALNYIRLYISLLKLRFPNESKVIFDIADGLSDFMVPKMILQPLVENSIRHGDVLKKTDGYIKIIAYKKKEYVHLYIKDNGKGMAKKQLEALNCSLKETENNFSRSVCGYDISQYAECNNRSFASTLDANDNIEAKLKIQQEYRYVSNHIGIVNVYQRLLLLYQHQCNMQVLSTEEGTSIHIQIYFPDQSDYKDEDSNNARINC